MINPLLGHPILQHLPYNLMRNPTLEGIKEFLESQKKKGRRAAYFNMGMFLFFALENFLIFERSTATYVVGTICVIVIPIIAYTFFVRMPRRWVVSDEEILEQIKKHNEWKN